MDSCLSRMMNGHFLSICNHFIYRQSDAKTFISHKLLVCMWVCCMWTSLNGNQVLLCSAKAGLLLQRQLGASRSSLTTSAGPLTSNTPLMADKLIWVWSGRTTNGHICVPQQHRVLLRPSVQNPGQPFSWDVKRKRLSGLWEGNKMSDPWLVKAAAC